MQGNTRVEPSLHGPAASPRVAAPSFLTDFASWDLSLFQAVDMPVPVDLILDSLLQDLRLVPLRPDPLRATAPTGVRGPASVSVFCPAP